MHFALCRILPATAVLVAVTAASSSPLTTPKILEMTAAHMGKAGRLFVIQTVVYPRLTVEGKHYGAKESMHFLFPDRFRSEIRSPGLHRIRVEGPEETVTVVNGKIVPEREIRGRSYLYVDLLRNRTGQGMIEFLQNTGVDPGITSLGRSGGKTAYVIGAEFPDMSKSQLWIDKETFFPRRFFHVSNETGARPPISIRFEDWETRNGFAYPMSVFIEQEQKTLRIIRVDSIEIDPSFDAGLLSAARLKSIHPEAMPAKAAAADETDEVREAVEAFRRLFPTNLFPVTQ
jgi:hypothetical protein